MFILETTHSEPKQPAFHLIGERQEVEAYNKLLIPSALGALAAEHITTDHLEKMMESVLEAAGMLTSIPNKWKDVAVAVLGYRRDHNLDERATVLLGSAVKGALTSAQYIEERRLLHEVDTTNLAEPTWLKPDGYMATHGPTLNSEGKLNIYALPLRELEHRLTPQVRAIFEHTEATHGADHYEIRHAALGASAADLPIINPTPQLHLGTMQGQTFTFAARASQPV